MIITSLFAIHINDVIQKLSFEETSENFEASVSCLGKCLGFESQRPDKESKEGPDNLWCLGDGDYILFECKNEVLDKRDEISKAEAGQMNVSYGWFQNNYPGASVLPVIIIPFKNIAKAAAFNFKVKVLRKNGLKSIKANLKNFFSEFHRYELASISDEKIQELINTHKLDVKSIKELYFEEPFQKK